MEFSVLSQYVAVLVVISASAERLAEAVKNLLGSFPIPFSIDQPNSDPQKESRRKLVILLLSFGCCYLTAYLSVSLLPSQKSQPGSTGPTVPTDWPVLPLSVLAMGGSSFWNSIQGYLNGLKTNIQAIAKKEEKAA